MIRLPTNIQSILSKVDQFHVSSSVLSPFEKIECFAGQRE